LRTTEARYKNGKKVDISLMKSTELKSNRRGVIKNSKKFKTDRRKVLPNIKTWMNDPKNDNTKAVKKTIERNEKMKDILFTS
jgi:hypothetical protein